MVPWLPPSHPVITPEQRFRFDGHEISRLPMPPDHILPPYTQDGSYWFSLVPQGQLGKLIFLKEDPAYFYALLLGSAVLEDDDSIALVRRFWETL